MFVFVNRETQVGVAPGRPLQTVHTDATGNAAARPAQTSGRFQVTKRDLKCPRTPFSETHSVCLRCAGCGSADRSAAWV